MRSAAAPSRGGVDLGDARVGAEQVDEVVERGRLVVDSEDT